MEELKRAAGEKAVEFVKDGMTLGLGTGSTTYYALKAIGSLVSEGYDLKGVPTSKKTEQLAAEFGIPLVEIDSVDEIDLTIDGADEVDPEKRLIKGMGGALLREKIVASTSREVIIVVDESKLTQQLGTRSMLPVEVIPFGHRTTSRKLEKLGCTAHLRGKDTPFITDNGNLIYDCRFDTIEDPDHLMYEINSIPGVVENGLFIDLASRVIVAKSDRIDIMD